MSVVLFVCGTGTGIGKTHVAASLLRGAAASHPLTLGFKPIESGCALWDPVSDHATLAAVSSFHVKQAPEYCFPEPISPHLAARRGGITIALPPILERVRSLACSVDLLVVELAGGLFSPLNESTLNADLLLSFQQAIDDARTLLIAPDRLGVLHDIGATTRAADAIGLSIDAIALSAPETADASTGSNEGEIRFVSSVPAICTVPRASIETLRNSSQISSITSILLSVF